MKKLLDLRPGECRWPLKDGPGGRHLFCAEPAADGSSYCEEHRLASIEPCPPDWWHEALEPPRPRRRS